MIGEVIDIIFQKETNIFAFVIMIPTNIFFLKKTFNGYHIFDKDQLKEAVYYIIYPCLQRFHSLCKYYIDLSQSGSEEY